jgi:hypothetical protein
MKVCNNCKKEVGLVERVAFIEGVQAGAKAVAANDLHEYQAAEEILDTFGDEDG